MTPPGWSPAPPPSPSPAGGWAPPAGPGGWPGSSPWPPAGRRRPWWAPAPIPALEPRISTGRAYGEALGVYLAFFGPSIVLAVGALAGFNPANPEGWWITAPNALQEVSFIALAVTVTLLLAGRRGRRPADVGLVLGRKRGGPGARQTVRIIAWAAAALIVGSIVTSALATGSYPFGHVDAANTVLELSASINAGFVEEIVVLGFLVTTLEQAGRPRWEIALVALACRGAYHIYYGPGVVGILLWAAVFLWLFWRFRSIVPMIILHVTWDSLVFLGQVDNAFSVLLILCLLALIVVAAIFWLVDRSSAGRMPPAWGTTWPGATGWSQPPPSPGSWAPPSASGGWVPPPPTGTSVPPPTGAGAPPPAGSSVPSRPTGAVPPPPPGTSVPAPPTGTSVPAPPTGAVAPPPTGGWVASPSAPTGAAGSGPAPTPPARAPSAPPSPQWGPAVGNGEAADGQAEQRRSDQSDQRRPDHADRRP